tara:strand:+ start:2675 stop:3565 length:891 start_codon:yes stop_codon:yes gene_type:complete
MKKLSKTNHVKALALLISLSCTTAHAGIIVGFGGQAATDGSGLTSNLVNANNIQDTSSGVFIETFDIGTAMTDLAGLVPGGFGAADTSYNYNDSDTDANAAGCGVNTSGATGINISTTGGGFGVTIGNQPGVAANPGNGNTSTPSIEDNTCYGFTPAIGSSGTVTIDYSTFLAGLGIGVLVDYFGFYWGSVDNYNDFTFIDSTSGTSETLSGIDLLAAQSGSPGNQASPSSNAYVNITFDGGFAFDSVMVTSDGIAGEFDNIVTGLNNRPTVPEPTSLAIFGLGLIGLALRKRKVK